MLEVLVDKHLKHYWKEVSSTLSTGNWTLFVRADGRVEWLCEHGVGHGKHIHGCEGCCSRKDYPGKKRKKG